MSLNSLLWGWGHILFTQESSNPAFANTVITYCFPVTSVRSRAWLLARGLCSMQSSSLLSHLPHKTKPTGAAQNLTYTRYSLVHSEFVFYGSVRCQDLLEPFSGLKNHIFLKVSMTFESGKSFWIGTQWNSVVVSWHQTIFRSHTAQVSCGFCQLRDSRVGCRFRSGGSQVPPVRFVWQWSYGSDSITAPTQVTSLKGTGVLEYVSRLKCLGSG